MTEQLDRELNLFNERAEELVKSNFLLSEQRLTALLQSIASSRFLCRLIGNCTARFSYEREFAACFPPRGDGGVYDSRVTLPEDPAKRVSLVFCLLMDFDAKRLDFYRFIGEHFPGDGSYYESFSSFCREIVLPFRDTLLGLAATVKENTEAEQKPEVDASSLVKKSATARAAEAVEAEKAALSALRGIGEEEIAELREITDGFLASLETEERELIRLMFLSYKYALRSVKREGSADKIAKILSGAGLL